MEIPLYQIDAFSSEIFKGNPAAVCPLKEWLPDPVLQNIAMENNLSETAFFVEEAETYRLRWFTPTDEVDLCGHATLAAAHALFAHLGYPKNEIHFDTNSGSLRVRSKEDLLMMNFPSARLKQTQPLEQLKKAIGDTATEVYKDTDYLYVMNNEDQVRNLSPDFRLLSKVDTRGVIATAPADGKDADFVSRFFAPAVGVDEDPVTGSAHTMLAPYWSRRFKKKSLVGKQISAREGIVYCEWRGDRVSLSGYAQTYLKGKINL